MKVISKMTKSKKVCLSLFCILAANVLADVLPFPREVVISGPEASKVAEMLVTRADENGTYAKGTAKVSCVKKVNETEFTCVIKKSGR